MYPFLMISRCFTPKIKSYIIRKASQAKLYLFCPLFDLIYLSLCLPEHTLLWIKGSRRNPLRLTGSCQGQQKIDLDLVICVPVGPGETLGIVDLIESAKCYIDGRYRFIMVDDSGGLSVWWAIRKYKEVDYLRNLPRRGYFKLPQTIRSAYRFALDRYRFPFILKMDADALFTGPGVIHDILDYFTKHPEAGILGSYRITSAGTKRDFSPMGDILEKNWIYWKEPIEKAQRSGYELGEHAQGGAYVISYRCLQDMDLTGYLTDKPAGTVYAEDVTFSLYARALGYEIHDFAREGQPFAIAWQGLPISREEVVRQGKKVIHSVKYTTEDIQTRNYFRKIREHYNAGSNG